MTNPELDKLLKSAPPPGRPDQYWAEFPKRVTAKLHWQSTSHDLPEDGRARALPRKLSGSERAAPRNPKWLFALGTGLAAICIFIGFELGFHQGRSFPADALQMAQAGKYYREIAAMFPNQVRAIAFDQHGPHLFLADKADVPKSAPLFVKMCGPDGCSDFVTFSGQQIQFNNENYEVLADPNGRVMLVGRHRVWFESQSSDALRVQARTLDTAM